MLQEWFSGVEYSGDVSGAINVLVSGCNCSRSQLERFSFFAEGQEWMKSLVAGRISDFLLFHNCPNASIDFRLSKRDRVDLV